MPQTINRTVNIQGLKVALDTTNDLKRASQLLVKELAGLEIGSKEYVSLSQNIAKVKVFQQQIRKEQRNLTNDFIAGGKAGVGAYRQLSSQLINVRREYKDLAAAGKENTAEAKALLQQVGSLDSRLKQIDATVGQHQRSVGKYSNALRGAGSAMLQLFGVGGAIAIGTAIMRTNIKTLIDFDKQLIAVGKTTDLSGSDLENLGQRVIKLGKDLKGISIQGLLATSEIAGQLGIRGVDNILNFSKTIEQLKLTSDIVGEESVRSFAKFIEISSDTVENADKLGSVITRLGNNFATTESAVLKNTIEIQKGIAVYNTSAQGVLALGAATEALGSQSEASRSAIQSTFAVIDQAITTGEGLEEILRLTGLTQEELTKQFGDDATGVFNKFIGGLAKAKDEGENLRSTLNALDLDEKRTFTVVGALAANYDVLSSAIDQASDEYRTNTALIKESEAATKSITSIAGDLSDAWAGMVLSIDSGNGIISTSIKTVLTGVTSLIGSFTDLIAVPVSEKIREEQVELNTLANRITDANISQEERNNLINQLDSSYPGFLDNLDKEALSNKEIADRLNEVNSLYVQKIVLQKEDEKVTDALEKLAERQRKATSQERDLRTLITQANLDYRLGLDLTNKSLSEQAVLLNQELLAVSRGTRALEEGAKARGTAINTRIELDKALQASADQQGSLTVATNNLAQAEKDRAEFEKILAESGDLEAIDRLTGKIAETTEEATETQKGHSEELEKSISKSKAKTEQNEAETGSLQDLKNQLTELRKELESENLTESELETKIQSIVEKEKEVQDLIDKLETLKQKTILTDKVLADGGSINEDGSLSIEAPQALVTEGPIIKPIVDDSQLKSDLKDTVDEIFKDQEELNTFIQSISDQTLEQQLVAVRTRLNEEELSSDERKRLLLEEDLLKDKYAANEKKRREEEEKRQEQKKAIFAASLDGLKEGFDTVFQISKESTDRETQSKLTAIETEYQTRIAAAKGNAAEQERLEKELAKKKLKIEQDAFKKNKKNSIAQALANGALGATKTIANLGFPAAIPGLIAVGVQTAAQVAVIKSQKFAEKGIRIDSKGNVKSDNQTIGNWVGMDDQPKSGSNNITTSHVLEHGGRVAYKNLMSGHSITDNAPVPMADGGRLDSNGQFQGRSHKEGGIKTVINGQPVEVEGGEFADVDENGDVNVINKVSSRIFRQRLIEINGLIYPGKARELSDINSAGGNGKKLAETGIKISSTDRILQNAVENRNRAEARQLQAMIQADKKVELDPTPIGKVVKEAIKEGFEAMTPILVDAVEAAVERGSNRGASKGINESNKEALREQEFRNRSSL